MKYYRFPWRGEEALGEEGKAPSEQYSLSCSAEGRQYYDRRQCARANGSA